MDADQYLAWSVDAGIAASSDDNSASIIVRLVWTLLLPPRKPKSSGMTIPASLQRKAVRREGGRATEAIYGRLLQQCGLLIGADRSPAPDAIAQYCRKHLLQGFENANRLT
jgi:hypothetical protein